VRVRRSRGRWTGPEPRSPGGSGRGRCGTVAAVQREEWEEEGEAAEREEGGEAAVLARPPAMRAPPTRPARSVLCDWFWSGSHRFWGRGGIPCIEGMERDF
jgi:hypothetical protein